MSPTWFPVVVALFTIVGCVSCIPAFSNPEYVCAGVDAPRRVYSVERTNQLRLPQFWCQNGYPQPNDHILELQVLQAYLDQDLASLSCETINLMNSRWNIQCISPTNVTAKGQWFGRFLRGEATRLVCSRASGMKQLQAALDPSFVQSKSWTWDFECKSRPYHSSECQSSLYPQKSLYNKILQLSQPTSAVSPEVRLDLAELVRFLDYKAYLLCSFPSLPPTISPTIPSPSMNHH